MKLIDLLVKKTNEEGWSWPRGAIGAHWIKSIKKVAFIDSDGYIPMHIIMHQFHDIVSDETETLVTKSQYESALASSDGWIEWGGGECPVETGSLVDIRDGDGCEWHGVKAAPKDEYSDASATFWEHKGSPEDNIIAYRPHREIDSSDNDDLLEQDLNECIGQDVDMPEWNGDGVPPIGRACEMQDSKGTWLPVVIIAKNDGFTFGWSYDYRIVLFGDKGDEFRPLRTEAEKAREKLAASLHIAAGASPIELNGIGPLYFKLADSIISGSVFGTTFKENK